METIINWLRDIEELAHSVYRDAADRFADDTKFSSFLDRLALDEASHFHLMGSAKDIFSREGVFPISDVYLDEEVVRRIEGPLRDCDRKLQLGSATKRDLMQCLIESEYSEWNHIFLYVVRNCQHYSRTFQRMASIIHAHGRRIDSWFDGLPTELKATLPDRRLPTIWTHRFLVVDDNDSLRELFREILSHHGEVITASDGREGLEKLKDSHFDVIISDQDMPAMTGMELLSTGMDVVPDIGKRFVLCTGNVTSELERFCLEQGVRLLRKPVRLSEFVNTVHSVMESAS
jgi:CheY-like chemotaxis protein